MRDRLSMMLFDGETAYMNAWSKVSPDGRDGDERESRDRPLLKKMTH